MNYINIKISRTEFIPVQRNLLNIKQGGQWMCIGKIVEIAHFVATVSIVEIAHFVATVSTRILPQTINQKPTVWSTLVTWSHCWRCALINSRAARNVFATKVSSYEIFSKKKIFFFPHSTKKRKHYRYQGSFRILRGRGGKEKGTKRREGRVKKGVQIATTL